MSSGFVVWGKRLPVRKLMEYMSAGGGFTKTAGRSTSCRHMSFKTKASQQGMVWILLSICMLLGHALPVRAKVLSLEKSRPVRKVAPYMGILEDPAGDRSIEQLVNPVSAAAFAPIQGEMLNLGMTDAVYWLRLEVNTSIGPHGGAEGSPFVWVFDLGRPFVRNVQVYVVSQGPGAAAKIKKISSQSSQCGFPGRVSRPGCHSAFYLPELTATPQTLYIRVVPLSSLVLSPVITTMKAYQEQVTRKMLRFGIILGIFLALSVYSLIMFVALRERSYAWHSLAALSFGGFFLFIQPLSSEYLLALPAAMVHRLALLALGGAFCFSGCFARCFLHAADRIVDRLLLFFMLQGGCLLLLALGGASLMFEMAYIGVASMAVAVMAGASLIAWSRGNRRARFIFIASVAAGAIGVVHVLVLGGCLSCRPGFSYLYEVGGIAGIGLLACALGDSVKALQHEREVLRVSERRHMELAFTDALTGLFNMRYFRTQLDLAIQCAEPLNQSFTLMMMDIDNFKLFNDRYGHLQGDQVLRQLGQMIGSVIREKDVACRYGGEEFAVILPGGDFQTAVDIYTRLQGTLLQWQEHEKESLISLVTLSVGVAEYFPGEHADDLIARADSAMYEAKEGGRDQLVLSEASDPGYDQAAGECATIF
ncbi:diguanylate cyclase, 7TMR-DISMED2 and 7TMR-DISM_7TM domain-containing [Syntrophotalea carbinolica DSM 2380]|uniref:diguanylate cyclase n=2 Tax=Syntrophotalea carbinolica TaxID=19 RepID=Q3A1I1_SYNC1|nr:diguanylate cyclase, 7TMR-DISMED2 and 7TMR-DISM_7TM domain-containing [Syntrophotalea carbinolica DSM 2380]